MLDVPPISEILRAYFTLIFLAASFASSPLSLMVLFPGILLVMAYRVLTWGFDRNRAVWPRLRTTG